MSGATGEGCYVVDTTQSDLATMGSNVHPVALLYLSYFCGNSKQVVSDPTGSIYICTIRKYWLP